MTNIKHELLNEARKKGREMALELFLDDDVNEGVGAGTYSFFEFNGVFFKIEISSSSIRLGITTGTREWILNILS